MPNWTHNTLDITGPRQALQRLAKLMKSDDTVFDFHKILPCPEELLKTSEVHYPESSPEYANREAEKQRLKEKYGHTGWYDWCVENWGTKWNACEAEMVNGDGKIGYGFQTAWAPPMPVIMALSDRFPSLTFTIECHEEATCFESFIMVIKGAGIISEEKIANTIYGEEDESA